jgi:hypothetical protein
VRGVGGVGRWDGEDADEGAEAGDGCWVWKSGGCGCESGIIGRHRRRRSGSCAFRVEPPKRLDPCGQRP